MYKIKHTLTKRTTIHIPRC